jgi:CO/xanthine dehydrogenase Mo-binding subunit
VAIGAYPANAAAAIARLADDLGIDPAAMEVGVGDTRRVPQHLTAGSWGTAIAHLVEVRVEPTTCRIRVPRVVSVADCGRVASPVTAASQVRGGVV